jgi:hypothetical protein
MLHDYLCFYRLEMRGRMSGGRINHQVVSFLLSGEQLVLTERKPMIQFCDNNPFPDASAI